MTTTSTIIIVLVCMVVVFASGLMIGATITGMDEPSTQPEVAIIRCNEDEYKKQIRTIENDAAKTEIRLQEKMLEVQRQLLCVQKERKAMRELIFDKLEKMSSENYAITDEFLNKNYTRNGLFKVNLPQKDQPRHRQ